MIKRLIDLSTAVVGLLILWPIFLIIAAWIKLDSKGPVFFQQERVGHSGRLFRIHKFRTMKHSKDFPGKPITIGHDHRISKAGSFLRKYKLDETPQLIDVLLGDMSLVGPRPELPQYVSMYPEEIRKLVLSVRPGITDLASLKYRNENEILSGADDPEQYYVQKIIPKKLAYCVYYVQNRSCLMDIAIIAKTLHRVTFR